MQQHDEQKKYMAIPGPAIRNMMAWGDFGGEVLWQKKISSSPFASKSFVACERADCLLSFKLAPQIAVKKY